MKQPLYKAIAVTLQALVNCRASGNAEWAERWLDRLKQFDSMLPSGSGFDSGSVILKTVSSAREILIETSFHHMDENGSYDGWTEHSVKVRADLACGFVIEVGGRDRNDIKDYIADTFHEALSAEVGEDDEVAESADQHYRV
jgi:hypothetical protein